MRIFLILKAITAILIGLVFALVCFSEIGAITENPIEYQNVYHFSKDAKEWEHQSIENYQKWNLIEGIVALVYVGLNGLSLLSKQLKIKYYVLVVDCLFVIMGIVNFFIWSSTGFDH